MYLILSADSDAASSWMHAELRRVGVAVEMVTARELVRAERWEHRVGEYGASGSVRLADGREIHGSGLRGVLNRVQYLPPDLFQHVRTEDRMYSLQEMTALYLSWLSSLPIPVLNRPTPQGLAGAWRHASEWASLAARAGLAAAPFRQPAIAGGTGVAAQWSVQVVGDSVIPVHRAAMPDAVQEGAMELARLSGTAILGLEFTRNWLFAGASPQPDLRLGGPAAVAAVVAAWKGGRS